MMVLAIGTLIPLPIGTLIPVVGTDWYFGSIAQVTRAAVGIAFPYLNRGSPPRPLLHLLSVISLQSAEVIQVLM